MRWCPSRSIPQRQHRTFVALSGGLAGGLARFFMPLTDGAKCGAHSSASPATAASSTRCGDSSNMKSASRWATRRRVCRNSASTVWIPPGSAPHGAPWSKGRERMYKQAGAKQRQPSRDCKADPDTPAYAGDERYSSAQRLIAMKVRHSLAPFSAIAKNTRLFQFIFS